MTPAREPFASDKRRILMAMNDDQRHWTARHRRHGLSEVTAVCDLMVVASEREYEVSLT